MDARSGAPTFTPPTVTFAVRPSISTSTTARKNAGLSSGTSALAAGSQGRLISGHLLPHAYSAGLCEDAGKINPAFGNLDNPASLISARVSLPTAP